MEKEYFNFDKDQSILSKYFDKIYIKHLTNNYNIYYPLIYKIKKYKLSCIIFKIDHVNNSDIYNELFKKYNNKKEIATFEIIEGKNIKNLYEIGYIDTTIKIINDAKKYKYNNILMLDDDFILHNDIETLFQIKINDLPSNWNILYLGCSQYTWLNESHKLYDIFNIKNNNYYIPFRPCGTFGIAIRNTIYDDLLDNLYKFLSPADTYPLWQIFNKISKLDKKYYIHLENYNNVFVIYPNLIIADVTYSNIRNSQDQFDRAQIMKWDLENYTYLYKNELDYIRQLIIDNNINIFDVFCNYDKLNINIILDKIKNLNENYIKSFINFYGCNNYIDIKIFGDIIHHLPEKKFVIIIPSFNNSKWYKKNLDSVINQHYSNYRIIYIDDCSDDNTYELVKNYFNKLNNNHILYKSKKRQRQGANKYISINMCNDDEIICILDGDDWFAHNNVLNILNYEYSNNDINCTWGRFQRVSSNEDDLYIIKNDKKISYIYSSIAKYKDNNYRSSPFYASHLKTFKASIYKKIPLKYFIDQENEFYKVATDLAEMVSILELSDNKYKMVSNILYSYNVENTNNHSTSYYNKDEYWMNYRTNAENRIRSMSKLYPELYQENDLSKEFNILYIITICNKVPIIIDSLLKLYNSNNILIKKSDTDLDNEYTHFIDYCLLNGIQLYDNNVTDKYNFIVYINNYIDVNNIMDYLNLLKQTKIKEFLIYPIINKYNDITFDTNYNYFVTSYNNIIKKYSYIIYNNINEIDNLVIGITI